jgi:hypothetical protein
MSAAPLRSDNGAHLLEDEASVERFAQAVGRVLVPGGLAFIAARNAHGLDRARCIRHAGNVYELKARPGHRVRYWDRDAFTRVFGCALTLVDFEDFSEPESEANPEPCPVTLMVGRRLDTSALRLAGGEP